MAKTLSEAKIATRGQRKRLTEGVHWRGIDPDIHLGYRKAKRGGSWLVRWYDGRYRQKTFATADDEVAEGTLDFNAAIREARSIVEQWRERERRSASGGDLTVGDAAQSYVDERNRRDTHRQGREVRSDAWSRLTRYVVGREKAGGRNAIEADAIASVRLSDLTERDLLAWQDRLPDSLKATTRQRLSNDFKAALNAAYLGNRSALPPALPDTITNGLSVLDRGDGDVSVVRENQVLTDGEVTALLSAARAIDSEGGHEGDLYRLIVLLAATGARFSQVRRLKVEDVQLEQMRILMPESRKGQKRHSGRYPVQIGPDVANVLKSALSNRDFDAPLLCRWRKRKIVGKIAWERGERGPWNSASEINRDWKKIRERAGFEADLVPYSLRHSSIVRGIRMNQPIRVVAALHDTSVAMIERHYSRFIAQEEDLARRSVVPLITSS